MAVEQSQYSEFTFDDLDLKTKKDLPFVKKLGVKLQTCISLFKNTHLSVKLLLVVLFLFAIISGYIAANLNLGIAPDEITHFNLSQIFSATWSIPKNTPDTYAYGPIGASPYLYYWINGRLLNLFALVIPGEESWSQLIALRFVNVFFLLLTMITCYLLAKEVINNRWWQLLTVFMLGNTLMFVFLSAGVNYDNLTNLLCMASILFLVRVLNHKSYYANSLLWMISISLASLTKVTALPLAFIMLIIWAYFAWRNRKTFFTQFKFAPKLVILISMLLVSLEFNLSIYGVNLVMYKTITPACTQILTIPQCQMNPVEVRNSNAYLSTEKITFGNILKGEYPSPSAYFLNFWFVSMLARTYGILAHKVFVSPFIQTFYRLFYLGILLIAVRLRKRPVFATAGIGLIAILYTVFLLFFNYNTELNNGFQHYAIQGRYIFPVIGTIYVLIVYFLSQLKSQIWQRVAYAATAVLFLLGGPLMIVTNYSAVFSSWFI